MVIPPKRPEIARRRMSPRAVVPSVLLFSTFIVAAALLLPPKISGAAQPEAAPAEPALNSANAGELCLRLSENPKGYMSDEALRRRWTLRSESCTLALVNQPENTHFKVAVARSMPYARKVEALALLREAAAQGNAGAYYELYEHHKSWDRGDLDKVPMVTRAEADRALHRAAELGHPFSTQMLAILLNRGSTVKRDPVAARYWAERAVANPAKDTSKGDLQVLLGRLLVTSDRPDERARGIDILERMATAGVFGARRELAIAIRKDDPVRARTLLEESLRPDPGGAPPPLAEMLIAGEGGPADPKRALALLTARTDTTGVKGVLGRLYLEGKVVPRDVQQAANLLDQAGVWDLDARTEVVRILAGNPEVRIKNPKHLLYYATEAAELDEPGAMAALIDLKLSKNAQFQDRPGACKLIETAVSRGDQSMTQRLADCRAR
ncbi:SEL1-like repeat protein [Bradyrhizobium sp. AUGA SZCCT0431]|uniref:tetratricopeptide repeat protein n=1 Tax=Bradyrhizobium sp. AUGA SZCCT0431 TaxID=2807674 RepID=UPI001BADE8A1|nr:SEL1-like repeat protein [Bradyrhizobium sp. AUGA SZCCT0431]MBR1146296.1 sel1 repeat family protein [Bradyrhizobium sp. AUGA SZCCT0431]